MPFSAHTVEAALSLVMQVLPLATIESAEEEEEEEDDQPEPVAELSSAVDEAASSVSRPAPFCLSCES